MPTPLDRFDFTQQDRDDLNNAALLDIVDPVEFACLMVNHDADVDGILADIQETAYLDRHWEEGRKRHARIAQIIDARTARQRYGAP